MTMDADPPTLVALVETFIVETERDCTSIVLLDFHEQLDDESDAAQRDAIARRWLAVYTKGA